MLFRSPRRGPATRQCPPGVCLGRFSICDTLSGRFRAKTIYDLKGEILFCENCGAAVSDGSAFCTSCGTKVTVAGVAAWRPTLSESSLFLLLFSANVDTMDNESSLESGELTEPEEALILNVCNKWGFYECFSSQDQLEAAIGKYQRFKGGSLNREDFIEQCAELLKNEPPLRDMTFYLCLEIIFLNGRPGKDSKEDLLIGELERILDVNPVVADFVFGLDVFKIILES